MRDAEQIFERLLGEGGAIIAARIEHAEVATVRPGAELSRRRDDAEDLVPLLEQSFRALGEQRLGADEKTTEAPNF